MKPKLLMIIILILTGSPTEGQDSDTIPNHHKTYSVNIQVGLNQIRERNLLPLVHKGLISELSFETEKINRGLRQLQFLFTYSRIKTSLEEMSTSGNIKFGLNYSYNFLIFQNNNLRYYSGPTASLSYSFMIFPNWDDSHGYWADYLSVGSSNIFSLFLRDKSELFTSLNFSLFSLFSRPEENRPFKMDDSSFAGIFKALNSNIEPGLMDKVLQINFRTEYRFPVFVTKREAITFNLNITRISGKDDQSVFQITNMFGIKIML